MNALVGFLRHLVVSAFHKDKRDWEIIIYCLGTASLFWLLNSMGKVYQYPIRIPVTFQYGSEKVISIASLPKNLEVMVTGTGWNLARIMLDWEKKPMRIHIKKPLETQYLIPQNWQPKLAGMFPSIKVESVLGDTIFCRFDRIEKRMVGLYVDLKDIKLKPGFQISSPIILTPRFIEFEGAASLVSQLPHMLPLKIDASNINQSFDQNIPVDFSEEYPRNELLTYSQEAINVKFSVRPSLEEELQLPIQLINSQLQPKLLLMERKVLVTFLISEKEKPYLKPEDFEVIADMETFNPADSTVLVSVRKKPEFVSDVQLGTVKTRVYAP